MIPGRPKGSLNKAGQMANLLSMSLGQRLYFEVNGVQKYAQAQRSAHASFLRIRSIHPDRKYSTQLFTAVSSSTAGDVRYLICIERVK